MKNQVTKVRLEIDARRRAKFAARIPRWYRWWAHLGATTALGGVVVGWAATGVRDLAAAELLVIPLALVAGNGIEWAFHRGVLHSRVPWLSGLYEGHAVEHHCSFTHRSMEVAEFRELALVMLPATTVILVYITVALVGALLHLVLRGNAAMLWAATSAGYVVAYELLHVAYHLPWTGLERLRRHHRLHHDPSLMRRWNFNVSVPLWDWVLGTRARG